MNALILPRARADRAAGNAAAALGLGGAGERVVGGHEPCGVVVARGEGVAETDAPTGQRVMNHHDKGCGHCKPAGWGEVPARTLVPLPDALSFEESAAISCGTGTAWGALKRLDVSGRDTLAVFGQGPVGLSATLRDLTHGEGVDAATDCSGNPDARVAAVRSARTWGRVAFVGEGNTTTFDVSQDLIRRQLTVHASWTFGAVGQEECARFIADRKLPLGSLLTHRFALAEAERAYRLFDTQTTGKVVFVF